MRLKARSTDLTGNRNISHHPIASLSGTPFKIISKIEEKKKLIEDQHV